MVLPYFKGVYHTQMRNAHMVRMVHTMCHTMMTSNVYMSYGTKIGICTYPMTHWLELMHITLMKMISKTIVFEK